MDTLAKDLRKPHLGPIKTPYHINNLDLSSAPTPSPHGRNDLCWTALLSRVRRPRPSVTPDLLIHTHSYNTSRQHLQYLPWKSPDSKVGNHFQQSRVTIDAKLATNAPELRRPGSEDPPKKDQYSAIPTAPGLPVRGSSSLLLKTFGQRLPTVGRFCAKPALNEASTSRRRSSLEELSEGLVVCPQAAFRREATRGGAGRSRKQTPSSRPWEEAERGTADEPTSRLHWNRRSSPRSWTRPTMALCQDLSAPTTPTTGTCEARRRRLPPRAAKSRCQSPPTQLPPLLNSPTSPALR